MSLTTTENKKLSEHGKIESLEARVLLNSSFVYCTDWDLGDIVTVRNKDWGVTMDSRITEVKEIYEATTGFALEVAFGNSVPTLSAKNKKKKMKTIVR